MNENISNEIISKDFNDILQKTIELKNKIENEISKISILYEKVLEDMNKSFQEKHKKLINEENDLKKNYKMTS